jgi:hypothetical protein
MFSQRSQWNQPIKVYYSFNNHDFYELRQTLQFVPDLVIENALIQSRDWRYTWEQDNRTYFAIRIQLWNAIPSVAYFCELDGSDEVMRAAYQKDHRLEYLLCPIAALNPLVKIHKFSLLVNNGAKKVEGTAELLQTPQPAEDNAADKVYRVVAARLNLGVTHNTSQVLQHVLLDQSRPSRTNRLFFQFNQSVGSRETLFCEFKGVEMAAPLTSTGHNDTYFCDLDVHDPITEAWIGIDVVDGFDSPHKRSVVDKSQTKIYENEVLRVPLVVHVEDGIARREVLPRILPVFLDEAPQDLDIPLDLQPRERRFMKLASYQKLRCVVQGLYLYPAVAEDMDKVVCQGALAPLYESNITRVINITLEVDGQQIGGHPVELYLLPREALRKGLTLPSHSHITELGDEIDLRGQ